MLLEEFKCLLDQISNVVILMLAVIYFVSNVDYDIVTDWKGDCAYCCDVWASSSQEGSTCNRGQGFRQGCHLTWRGFRDASMSWQQSQSAWCLEPPWWEWSVEEGREGSYPCRPQWEMRDLSLPGICRGPQFLSSHERRSACSDDSPVSRPQRSSLSFSVHPQSWSLWVDPLCHNTSWTLCVESH